MSILEGLNPDEQIKSVCEASFLTLKSAQAGSREDFIYGNIVLTQKGIVFLQAKGVLRGGRKRHHAYLYEHIKFARLESRGLTGSIVREEFLVVGVVTQGHSLEMRYSLRKKDSTIICATINSYLNLAKAETALEDVLFHFLKPRTDVTLSGLIHEPSIRNAIIDLIGMPTGFETLANKIVMEHLQRLIAEGRLDGAISRDRYVSKIELSRKSIQYQVTIDFTSLLSQLKTKGIVLESIECPSCKGKLEYPESGSMTTCKYCGASVTAIDIFEKFKGLLNI